MACDQRVNDVHCTPTVHNATHRMPCHCARRTWGAGAAPSRRGRQEYTARTTATTVRKTPTQVQRCAELPSSPPHEQGSVSVVIRARTRNQQIARLVACTQPKHSTTDRDPLGTEWTVVPRFSVSSDAAHVGAATGHCSCCATASSQHQLTLLLSVSQSLAMTIILVLTIDVLA
jgi:hypothetical protein